MGIKLAAITLGALIFGANKIDTREQQDQDFNDCVAEKTAPLLPADLPARISTQWTSGKDYSASVSFRAAGKRNIVIETHGIPGAPQATTVTDIMPGELPRHEIYISSPDDSILSPNPGAVRHPSGVNVVLFDDAVKSCARDTENEHGFTPSLN